MTASTWAVPNPAQKYGGSLAREQQATRDDTRLTAVAGPPAKAGKAFSPREPLFWFAVIAATSFGLMAYSTTIRFGAAEVGVNVGKAG